MHQRNVVFPHASPYSVSADLNGDGVISLDEMTDYFTHVFQTMAEAEGTAPSVPIDQLARATAEDCFAVADANGDGSITFDEFRVWYSGLDGGGAQSAVGGKAPRPLRPLSRLRLL